MSIQGNPHSNRQRAFTFVELLVVMAIVAILAALLFPVFARARGLRAGSCLGSRSQVGRAFMLYAQDYDDVTVLSNWTQSLPAYVGKHAVQPCPLVLNRLGRVGHLDTIDEHSKKDKDEKDKDGDNDNGGRGFAGGSRRSPNMTYHNGVIMPHSVTGAIFWGTTWATYTGDKITGIDLWYNGFGGSNYAKTSTEYKDSSSYVGTSSSYVGHVIDSSKAPASAPSTSTILSEVCKMIPNPDASGLGYYAVYTDTKRGSAGYCAWHSYGSCNGIPVQFAFFFNLDGDSGCDPGDSSGLHSQGLAALANVSGHELSETMTDPTLSAWYDSSGAENGDKCAWSFGAPLVTFSNGSQWKIQGEWSNAAYTAGTGYANTSGQKGCLSGK